MATSDRRFVLLQTTLIGAWYLLMPSPFYPADQVCSPDDTHCLVVKIFTKQSDCLLERSRHIYLAEHPEIWPPGLIALAGGTPAGIKDMQHRQRAMRCVEAKARELVDISSA